jgi:hypothetical protein
MDTSESPLNSIDSSINNISNSHNSSASLQFVLNCLLHISILFSFLILLFISTIEPLSKSAFKSELGHIINHGIDNAIPKSIDLNTIDPSQLDSVLDSILNPLPIYSSFPFSKNIIKSNLLQLYNSIKSNPYILNNYIKEYSSENYLIKKHNDNIISFGISIIIILFTITILLCITFKYYYPDSINLSKLFIENLLTFILIGLGEYWFFTTYAKNFIPAPPSLLSNSAIDNIKNILNK